MIRTEDEVRQLIADLLELDEVKDDTFQHGHRIGQLAALDWVLGGRGSMTGDKDLDDYFRWLNKWGGSPDYGVRTSRVEAQPLRSRA